MSKNLAAQMLDLVEARQHEEAKAEYARLLPQIENLAKKGYTSFTQNYLTEWTRNTLKENGFKVEKKNGVDYDYWLISWTKQ